MSLLPADEGIVRFKENEERFDEFINGDGYLSSEGVTVEGLASVVNGIKMFNSRGAWVTATAYAVRDLVTSGGIWYVCVTAHTSSAAFATDSPTKWRVHQGATQNGTETLTNKTFGGAVGFATNGSRIGISGSASYIIPSALFNIENDDVVTCGLRVTSYWNGSTATPYQNNDNSLWETFNNVASNSTNYSWSISAPNAYNNIPVGVTDSGERVGVYGWATSVNIPGLFEHEGTLASQVGVKGRAGFQNATAATAVIESAVGVKGEIYGESAGSTIENAIAGHFSSVSTGSVIENNTAVYASASGGVETNFSFYGAEGVLFNNEKAIFGSSTTATQSNPNVSVRGGANSLEFGNPDPAGYGSNLGSTAGSGLPFLGFFCEAEPSGNTFKTRGKLGIVAMGASDGSLVFGRLTNVNAPGQTVEESARFNPDGQLVLQETAILQTKTPATAGAAGVTGEIAWDSSYVYVCVATNTWKRSALTTW